MGKIREEVVQKQTTDSNGQKIQDLNVLSVLDLKTSVVSFLIYKSVFQNMGA